MKRTVLLGILTLGVAVLASSSAYAVCSPPVTFGQLASNCGGAFCYVLSPTGVASPASMGGSFWAWEFGNVTVGLGDDNGSQTDDLWLTQYSTAYPFYISGSWGIGGADGCIAGKVGTGKTDECQIISFSEQSAGGDIGYWAAASAVRIGANSPQIDFTFQNGGGTPTDITLVPIPKPFVTGSTRVSAGQTDVTVRCDVDTSGFYGDGCTTFAETVDGCKFYTIQQGTGGSAPSDRTVSAWTATAGGTIAPNATETFSITCAGDDDVWVAASVVFDSGFSTGFVSANSTQIECGPNIAEPRETQFKLIKERRGSERRGR